MSEVYGQNRHVVFPGQPSAELRMADEGRFGNMATIFGVIKTDIPVILRFVSFDLDIGTAQLLEQGLVPVEQGGRVAERTAEHHGLADFLERVRTETFPRIDPDRFISCFFLCERQKLENGFYGIALAGGWRFIEIHGNDRLQIGSGNSLIHADIIITAKIIFGYGPQLLNSLYTGHYERVT